MADILIELDKRDESFYSPMLEDLKGNISEVDATRFDGVLLLQLLAGLNAVTIPLIGKLIAESIRSKRYVVVKKKGIEIRGLDADNVIAVLREINKK